MEDESDADNVVTNPKDIMKNLKSQIVERPKAKKARENKKSSFVDFLGELNEFGGDIVQMTGADKLGDVAQYTG